LAVGWAVGCWLAVSLCHLRLYSWLASRAMMMKTFVFMDFLVKPFLGDLNLAPCPIFYFSREFRRRKIDNSLCGFEFHPSGESQK
jgi:hypothetical protein